MEFIGFFREYEAPYGCFSNWYECKFVVNGITFKSSEHYMMYHKCLIMGDKDAAELVLKVDSPMDAKKVGRIARGDITKWQTTRYQVVKEGVKQKFLQNKELLNILLSTKDAVIAECNPRDLIWSIGLSLTDNRRFNKNEWRGDNYLGYILMEVRDELRKETNKNLSSDKLIQMKMDLLGNSSDELVMTYDPLIEGKEDVNKFLLKGVINNLYELSKNIDEVIDKYSTYDVTDNGVLINENNQLGKMRRLIEIIYKHSDEILIFNN